jgi:hypothetical protein
MRSTGKSLTYAVAAQRLDGGAAHRSAISLANSLAMAASFRQGWPASRRLAACQISWRAASICVAHVGQAKAHGLVVEDGLAKALALFGVVQRALEGAARHAHALRRDADAPAFQAAQGNLVALALGANQVLGRDAAVVKLICAVSLLCWPSLSSSRATW